MSLPREDVPVHMLDFSIIESENLRITESQDGLGWTAVGVGRYPILNTSSKTCYDKTCSELLVLLLSHIFITTFC